ncbi:integration host factor subunit beta [Candidatus Pelagibacter sp.]|nr:integration host factor subunit beta [Candidatus Pelagibacter sp.]
MPITKSELVKQLSKTYPNLLKKDLEKFFDIFINEVKLALKNDERVELRGWGVFLAKNQKGKTSRNPKTGEKVTVDEKKSISFKMSKDLFNEINDE